MAKKIVLTKKEKVALMLNEHIETFRKLKIPNPFFSPRPFYFDDKGRGVSSFFTNELTKGVDIYLEKTTFDYEPIDLKRTLYVWKFNPHYNTEYQQHRNQQQPDVIRYVIPVEEFFEVNETIKESIQGTVPEDLDFDIPDPDTDAPFEAMTLRDYACIHGKIAKSHKPWLNEIIKSSNK